MKLVIQIPCYNEEKSLPVTLSHLPREVKGFSKVEWLIINDGSNDKTIEIAKQYGVDRTISFKKNQGLAKAYMAGLEECIKLGADIIVNTDADGQYNAEDIPKLVKPILEGKADIVIGERPIREIKYFPLWKKFLQKLGSLFVRVVSKTDIPDVSSGFRAMSRDAAMRLNVFNDYTYTIETIIQAGRKKMAITSVPIRVNEELRPSRLFKNVFFYIKKSIVTIIRIFVIYKPFRFFMIIGGVLFTTGFLIGVRFLYFYFNHRGAGHVQSLILATILLVIGFQAILVAFLSDLLAANRKLMEDIQYQIRKEKNKGS